MPILETKDGKNELVPEDELGEAARSGRYRADQEVRLRDQRGQLITAPLERAPEAAAEGATPEDPAETAEVRRETALEREYGGAGQTALATGEALARGITIGGTDLVGLTSSPSAQARREEAPGWATVGGELVGAAIPSLVTGGAAAGGTAARAGGTLARAAASTPAGAAARVGASVGARGGRGARVLGHGVEGAIHGAGMGVTQLSHGDEPVTLERAASTIGSGVLLGGGAGMGTSVAAKAAGKAIGKSKDAVSSVTERFRRRASGTADDVAEEVSGYHQRANQIFEVAPPEHDARAIMFQTQRKRRGALDNPVGLNRRPQQIMDPLERDANALRRLRDESDEILGEAAKRDASAVRTIRETLDEAPPEGRVLMRGPDARDYATFRGRAAPTAKQAREGIPVSRDEALAFAAASEAGEAQSQRGASGLRKLVDDSDRITIRGSEAQQYGQFVGRSISKSEAKKGVPIRPEDARRYADAVDSGEVHAARQRALHDEVPDLLARNERLQETVQAAQEAQKQAGQKGAAASLVERGAQGAAGGVIAGPFGAAGALIAPKIAQGLSDMVTGRLAKAGAEAGTRASRALDATLSAARVSAERSTPAATRALSEVSYGETPDVQRPQAEAPTELARQFRDRSAELRSQTAMGPQGQSVMRPAARRRVAERLSGVRATSPMLADRMETTAARRVEYLADKLPRRPDGAAMQIGPDRWQPSDMEMRTFARHAAAVEDPAAVEERMADGTLTPEDAEALREVYPERYEELRGELIDRLPEIRETLPYEKRLTLSIMFGAAVDPIMSPNVVETLQANYATEPGTDGGAHAPRAQPAFGSIQNSAEEPTPAQSRSTGQSATA